MKEGWKYERLGNITTSINGLWKGKKEPFVKVGVIRNANFNKDITLNFSNIEYLEVEERQYKVRKLQDGDLIVEKSGGSEKQPVGRTVLFRGEGDFSVSNFTSILRINDKRVILPEFLYKYLLFVYYSGATRSMQKATTGIHNILYDKFLEIRIPIPPLPEQERIVSLLDAEFAKIDAIKANAEKQLQDAKALFQSTLKDYLTLKEGWKICKIGDIARIRRGLTYSKSDEVDNSNNIVLRSNNIDLSTNKLVYDELKFIHQSINIPEDKYLKKGELLMCMSNGSKVHLGKVALNETDSIYVFGGFMAAISHDNSLIDKFFFYSLITPRFKEYIKSLSDGANINNLKARDIENYTIPIPPLSEQHQIAEQLDKISAKIHSLQSNFDTTVTLCNDLKQSILKDIFG